MAFFKKLLLAPALFIFIFSCKKEVDPNAGTYSSGIFIVNEGPFLSGTGTVSFYDRDKKTTTNDIFGKENAGAVLGNIAQSMAIQNGKAYLVLNNANKIEVVDAATFKSLGKIDSLALPRFFLALDDKKAWVTQWGLDGISGSVAVVDLATNSVVKTIPVGQGPEKPLLLGGKIYVPLGGGYGRDKRIAVLDPATETVEKYIEVSDNPTSLAADFAGGLWAICRGHTDYVVPANSTDGGLYKIEDQKVVGTPAILPNGSDNLVASPTGFLLFYTSGGKTYQANLATSTASVFADKAFYALGFDWKTGNLLAADAKDYTGPGEVVIFQTDGKAVDTLTVGIVPTDFWVE